MNNEFPAGIKTNYGLQIEQQRKHYEGELNYINPYY